MKIELSKADYEYTKEILTEVDSSAYDPVYRGMIERMEATKKTKANEVSVILEEFEIFNVLEAFNYYTDALEVRGNTEEIKKASALTKKVSASTGLSL